MKYTDVKDYIDGLDNLRKIEITIEDDEEMSGSFYITKTKETYVYGSEAEADAKIDNVRLNVGFAGAEKKFKAGKVSKKTGEEISPDTYIVVVKLTH